MAVLQAEPGDVQALLHAGKEQPLSSASQSASLKLFIMIFCLVLKCIKGTVHPVRQQPTGSKISLTRPDKYKCISFLS